MEESRQFFDLFRETRKEIAGKNGYHLETAIKKTFEKWNSLKIGTSENTPTVRFLLPSDEQLIKFAVLFNNGKLEPEKLTDMVAMCTLVIDRLYENGNVLIPTLKEVAYSKDIDFKTLEDEFRNGC